MRTGNHFCAVVWPTPKWVGGLLVAIFASLWMPFAGAAQDATCTDCTVYAPTELNLRQDPSQDSEILRIIPAGAELNLTPEADVNGYTPVTYDSVPGWVVSLGVAPSDKGVGATSAAPSSTGADESQRVTLEPLTLRNGPALDAESILVMPEGSLVTLTGEGAENGYVTVDFDGETGWAYADYLSEVSPQ